MVNMNRGFAVGPVMHKSATCGRRLSVAAAQREFLNYRLPTEKVLPRDFRTGVRFPSDPPKRKAPQKGGLFFLPNGESNGSVVNDMPVACQSRP